MKRTVFILILASFAIYISCSSEGETDFTGNEVSIPMISGTVEGNTTNGMLTIRERKDGSAQIEIIVDNVIKNAIHPIHLHYGSLEDNGNVATILSELTESNGVGSSVSILTELSNGQRLSYNDLMVWDGSIKVHFEATGPLEKALIVSSNIGLNQADNSAYMTGDKQITICNSQY